MKDWKTYAVILNLILTCLLAVRYEMRLREERMAARDMAIAAHGVRDKATATYRGITNRVYRVYNGNLPK